MNMNHEHLINNLVESSLGYVLSCVNQTGNNVYFVDPNEQREISAHYGATHAAVGMVMFGHENKKKEIEKQGITLVNSILERWDDSIKQKDFHFDFNNFALCVLIEYLEEIGIYAEIRERAKTVVLHTTDSKHDTINWMPMRWYVNQCRGKWTKDNKYSRKCKDCRDKIESATYTDGFIDDRLPKGTSFNLQYDLATVAILQFLNIRGEKLDIEKKVGALINVISPDGDINYMGRGCNQVFAWGLWIYLLSTAELNEELCLSLGYSYEKIIEMLTQNNMFLNPWDGKEKYLWWDYHYSSVYIAHFFFWLVMTQLDGRKQVKPKIVNDGSSGIRVYCNPNFKVVLFNGRQAYLAEKGPSVSLIWSRKYGVITKGSFAPWQGLFGNKYYYPGVSLINYTGVNVVSNSAKGRITRKIEEITGIGKEEKYGIQPLFCDIQVTIDNGIHIIWTLKRKAKSFLSIISQNEVGSLVFSDGRQQEIKQVGTIRNQYDFVRVYHSACIEGTRWELEIQ